MKKTYIIIIIVLIFIILLVIVLATLKALGILDDVDNLTNVKFLNSKFKKVYDSMQTSGNCFISLENIDYFMSHNNILKIHKYMINNNMLPLDNPFKQVIETKIIDCSPKGSRMVFTLDLSKYNGLNPFKQGDSIYIYDTGDIGADNINRTKKRYVYATNNENPRNVMYNQIMISEQNPCNYTECNLNNALPIFVEGDYKGGGYVRFIGNRTIINGFISNRPQLMFYCYMAYKGYVFDWPFESYTPSKMQELYSKHYSDYLQWLLNFPETCTNIDAFNNTNIGFETGSVIISGGSGSGMEMYLIKMNLFDESVVIPIITSDGVNYKNDDTITITQGDKTKEVKIKIGIKCNNRSDLFTLENYIYISYKTNNEQFNKLIDYALSLDSNINTIFMYTKTNLSKIDNYNDANIIMIFAKTNPSNKIRFNDHNQSNLYNINKICICNNIQDEYKISELFPKKINQCSNQIIYTDLDKNPYNFVNMENNDCKIDKCN